MADIEDIIDEDLSVEEIEKLLDDKIPNYNKFTANHPMTGVTFSKSKNKYQIKFNEIDTYSVKLDIACRKVMENFYDDEINCFNKKQITKEYIQNNDCYLIEYIYQNKTYYDIEHILHNLKLQKSSHHDKYNSIRNDIKGYFWHKNEYNGFICRELITRTTVKKLIHSSNTQSTINLAKLLDINVINNKIPKKETICSNQIIKVFNEEKYQEQKQFGPYRVDLYFPDYHLAIECDEHDHKNRDPDYERKRQKYIENEYDCTFMRFNPDDKEFDICDIISQIHYFIVNHI